MVQFRIPDCAAVQNSLACVRITCYNEYASFGSRMRQRCAAIHRPGPGDGAGMNATSEYVPVAQLDRALDSDAEGLITLKIEHFLHMCL